MSAHGHAHDEHDDDEHDDHPVEAPPPEPESPAWLPLLGGALFLGALLLFLATRSTEPEAGADATEAGAAAPSAAAPAAGEPAPTPP